MSIQNYTMSIFIPTQGVNEFSDAHAQLLFELRAHVNF